MRGESPQRGNRTRMSLVCPTVVLVLPGIRGRILTRESPLYLGVCELPGISGNLLEPRNGACRGSRYTGQADVPTGTYKALDAGWYHNCAIASDDTITCWSPWTAPAGVRWVDSRT